jgi:hypothetical protein
MENIVKFFQGKLYSKESIKNWELPHRVVDKLDIENHEYFFLTISPEKEAHGQNHVHLCIYPTKSEPVYLLEVETPTILPELLHNCLEIIKKSVKNIITSTGFCKSENVCYFGVFFSLPETMDKDLEELLSEVKQLDNIRDINYFKYTCEGCGKL